METMEIKILVYKKTGKQEVTIGGIPYRQTTISDKIAAIQEATKAQCGIGDFIREAVGDLTIFQPVTGHA